MRIDMYVHIDAHVYAPTYHILYAYRLCGFFRQYTPYYKPARCDCFSLTLSETTVRITTITHFNKVLQAYRFHYQAYH